MMGKILYSKWIAFGGPAKRGKAPEVPPRATKLHNWPPNGHVVGPSQLGCWVLEQVCAPASLQFFNYFAYILAAVRRQYQGGVRSGDDCDAL